MIFWAGDSYAWFYAINNIRCIHIVFTSIMTWGKVYRLSFGKNQENFGHIEIVIQTTDRSGLSSSSIHSFMIILECGSENSKRKFLSSFRAGRLSIWLASVKTLAEMRNGRSKKKLRPPPPLNNNIRASPANTVGPNTQPSTARGERVGGVAILFPDWKSSKFRAPLTARPLSELH